MTKYHIAKNGDARPCTATERSCPLGGEHYDSMKEAASAQAGNRRLRVPTPLKDAQKLAEEAAGRSLTLNHVWIEKPSAGAYGEYQVRYTLPRTDGVFICNLPLVLEPEDFAYYEWYIERPC